MNKFLTFAFGEKGSEFEKTWVLILHFYFFGIYLSGLDFKILTCNFLTNGGN